MNLVVERQAIDQRQQRRDHPVLARSVHAPRYHQCNAHVRSRLARRKIEQLSQDLDCLERMASPAKFKGM